jgi:hypothetical protein
VLSGGSGSYKLDVLGGTGHAGPAHEIIAGTSDFGASDTPYSHAVAAVAGSGPHNPFVNGSGTFDLSIAGLTPGETISNVEFQYGTTDGSNHVPGVLATPEPAPFLALGLGAVALLRRRKK